MSADSPLFLVAFHNFIKQTVLHQELDSGMKHTDRVRWNDGKMKRLVALSCWFKSALYGLSFFKRNGLLKCTLNIPLPVASVHLPDISMSEYLMIILAPNLPCKKKWSKCCSGRKSGNENLLTTRRAQQPLCNKENISISVLNTWSGCLSRESFSWPFVPELEFYKKSKFLIH